MSNFVIMMKNKLRFFLNTLDTAAAMFSSGLFEARVYMRRNETTLPSEFYPTGQILTQKLDDESILWKKLFSKSTTIILNTITLQ